MYFKMWVIADCAFLSTINFFCHAVFSTSIFFVRYFSGFLSMYLGVFIVNLLFSIVIVF